MGLFNFIYKLTIIFSNKKKLKIFVVLALVVILIFAWSRGVFASTAEDDLTLLNYQLSLQENMINYLRLLYQQQLPGFDQSAFTSTLGRLRDYQVFVSVPTGDQNTLFWLYFYTNNSNNTPNSFQTDATWSIGLNSGTQIDCKVADFNAVSVTRLVMLGGNRATPVFNNTSTSFLLPAPMYMVRSTYINDFLEEMGIYSRLESTYSTSDEELQSIARSGFNSVNSNIQQQTNTMTNSINSASSAISNSINSGVASVTNTLTDDSVSVDSSQLPTDNTTDPTTEGLNNIFIMIKDAFTGTPQAVNFPVPFTNQSFTIEPGFTLSCMRKGGLGTMAYVIQLYWYYRIYSYIFLKYVELLEKLKEGEFEHTVGNIKKEVL